MCPSTSVVGLDKRSDDGMVLDSHKNAMGLPRVVLIKAGLLCETNAFWCGDSRGAML